MDGGKPEESTGTKPKRRAASPPDDDDLAGATGGTEFSQLEFPLAPITTRSQSAKLDLGEPPNNVLPKKRVVTKRGRNTIPEITGARAGPLAAQTGIGEASDQCEDDAYSHASSYAPPRVTLGDMRNLRINHPHVPISSQRRPPNTHRDETRNRVTPNHSDYHLSDDEIDIPIGRPLSAAALLNTMKRWDLSFSGKRGEDVEDFLTRIEEGRAFLPVRDNVLLKAIPFFLRNAALVWYRGHSREFSSWELAKSAFRRYYGDPDYQIALREEITDRTQADGEKVGDYIACMRGLFSRTSPPWGEREQVRYVHRNLLPQYRIAITINEGTTMDELETSAIRHEKILESAGTRRQPPKPEHSLCPSFAYRGQQTPFRPNRKPFVAVRAACDDEEPEGYLEENDAEMVDYLEAARDPRTNRGKTRVESTPNRVNATGNLASTLAWKATLSKPKLPTDSRAAAASSSPVQVEPELPRSGQPRPTIAGQPPHATDLLCWNCQKTGHRHRDCPEPRRVFCYRCSYSGVTTQNCPFCNQGNARRGT